MVWSGLHTLREGGGNGSSTLTDQTSAGVLPRLSFKRVWSLSCEHSAVTPDEQRTEKVAVSCHEAVPNFSTPDHRRPRQKRRQLRPTDHSQDDQARTSSAHDPPVRDDDVHCSSAARCQLIRHWWTRRGLIGNSPDSLLSVSSLDPSDHALSEVSGTVPKKPVLLICHERPSLPRVDSAQTARRAYDDRLRRTTANGGRVRLSEKGRPCIGSASVATRPQFPRPLPPYTVASLLSSSIHSPSSGTPIR